MRRGQNINGAGGRRDPSYAVWRLSTSARQAGPPDETLQYIGRRRLWLTVGTGMFENDMNENNELLRISPELLYTTGPMARILDMRDLATRTQVIRPEIA